MCTVSWSCRESKVFFFFNRDERTSRPRADYPSESFLEGVRVLSPKDPLGGGSWIVANEYGLVVSLLNNYEETRVERSETMRTRGEIPMSFATCRSVEEVSDRLADSNFDRYLPFHLCCLDRSGDVVIVSWNGDVLERRPCTRRMLTTSSFKPREVQTYREELFRKQAPNSSEELFLYHMDRSHADLAFNPLMKRADAFTQSLSVVEISDGEISFKYYDLDKGCSGFRETSQNHLKLKALNQ